MINPAGRSGKSFRTAASIFNAQEFATAPGDKDLAVYAQGFLYDPTASTGVVIGLTDAAELLIGLEARLGERYRFYRIAFNVVAFVTLVPVLVLERGLDGPVLVLEPFRSGRKRRRGAGHQNRRQNSASQNPRNYAVRKRHQTVNPYAQLGL